MDRVIRNTEQYLYEHGAFGSFDAYTPTGCDCQHATLSNAEAAIAAAAGDMSRRARVSAIVARGHSETLLSLISSQRPSAVILTPATTPRAVALGCLSWGVFPQRLPDATTASPMDLVRSLESQVELEQRGGFWVVASSSEAKKRRISAGYNVVTGFGLAIAVVIVHISRAHESIGRARRASQNLRHHLPPGCR